MAESEPIVGLAGESSELDGLEWWSNHSNFGLYNVVKIGNNYYLKSPRFRQKNDAELIYGEAKRLLPIIKAFAKIRGFGAQSITIGTTVHLGGEKSHFVEAGQPRFFVIGEFMLGRGWFWKEDGTPYFRGWQTGKVIEIGREPFQVVQEFADNLPELEVLVQKGLQLDSDLNPLEKWIDEVDIYETFRYFAKEPSWYNLYNTYEMIKFDVDRSLAENNFDKKVCKITKYGWAEPDELKKFKRVANDPKAEGNPRHSSAYYKDQKVRKREQKEKPSAYWEFKDKLREERKKQNPSSSQLMVLHEANALITQIFRGWCKYKANQYQVKMSLSSAALAARSIMAYISSSIHSSKNHSGK